ncbi:MAG: hypothetical protein EOQ41_03045 [Mesorhizobium sp.]|uniref:hypothetical protein n=1 Tax=Mesorhizobium sp. TaxID=1871066 RepID=UPI000FE5E3D7|nr:hypothetical protein [Mesorhizobium sp.]RWB35802.1 MAG: hypothetical protein EOQ41_03045 [Mesorhizobium sp.]
MRIFAVTAIVVLTLGVSNPACAETEYDLTEDGVKLLRRIANKDKYMGEMAKSVDGLAALNTLLSRVAPPGPAKLVLTWNKGIIAGWRSANSNLAKIGQATTCQDLILYLDNDPADKDFFSQLSEARGCNDL